MHNAEALLVALIAAPAVLLMVLRVNAALVFLSLCLGDVMVQFVANDTNDFISMFAARASKLPATSGNIKLGLLLLPVLLTTLFMIKTVRGHGKLVLNILPAAGVGLLGALLVVPLLPTGTSANIVHSSLWQQVVMLQTLIVGASALLCLMVLWMQRPKTGEEKHSKH